jgi:predicted PurR-regulated permease PerM
MATERQSPGGAAASAFFVAGTAVALAWLLAPLFELLLLVFAGVLVAVVLRGVSAWIARHSPLPEGWATALTLVALALTGVVLTWFAGARIATQVDDLRRTLPAAASNAADWLKGQAWGRPLLSRLHDAGDLLTGKGALSRAGGALSTAVGGVGSLILFVFVALFVTLDPSPYRRGLLLLVPSTRRERAARVLDDVGQALRGWMLGKIISMTAVGLLTWVGLLFLGVPLPLTLALIAALLTFIPNFGPVLSAVPAVLLALMSGPAKAAWVGGLYLAVQAVESYLVTPFVQKKTLSLPPALTIVSQAILGTVAGGVGLVVATPLTAAVLVLFRELYVDKSD